jgi:glycolate oxidase FAD binding subunit
MGLRAEPSAQDVWSSREQLFTNSALVFKATMLPTEIAPMMQAIHDLGGSAVAQATGILTGSFASASSLQRHVALRTQLEAANRSLTFLHVPAETAFDRWGKLPDTLPLMRAVKQHFDPRGILNPGRFLGNI